MICDAAHVLITVRFTSELFTTMVSHAAHQIMSTALRHHPFHFMFCTLICFD